jgi:MEMO1 family protein
MVASSLAELGWRHPADHSAGHPVNRYLWYTGSVIGTRRPAVAGRFYPRDPTTLAATVDRLLDAVRVPDREPLAPAYVVPHAGYAFSGPTAARVYARLRHHAGRIERVVLIGPAHFVPFAGCAAPASAAWATPLGELPVDGAVPPGVTVDDGPHAPEHSLEVQLPFLQRALGRPVPILPIAVGRASAGEVAAVLTATGANAVVLCSTDLSHYLDRAAAMDRDARTVAAIEALAADQIGIGDACGVFALRGLLTWARAGNLRPALLGLATSADTAGSPDRVVGYGAFSFTPIC